MQFGCVVTVLELAVLQMQFLVDQMKLLVGSRVQDQLQLLEAFAIDRTKYKVWLYF
jgi:hypothetical protein